MIYKAFTWLTLVAILALAINGALIMVHRQNDPAYIWGKYYEALYGSIYKQKVSDAEGVAKCEKEMTEWFNVLKDRKLIVPIGFDIKNDADTKEFQLMMSRATIS